MKRFAWVPAVLLAAAVTLPAHAGHKAGHKAAKCTYDAQTCLNHMSAKKDKGWMGVEYESNEAGAYVVKKVVPGAPAEKAGFQVGDVLITRNGIKLSDHEALKADKDSWKAGAAVTYTVQRGGAEQKLAVTLAPMPEEVFASMVGAHMISDHMATAAMATTSETEKAAATKK